MMRSWILWTETATPVPKWTRVREGGAATEGWMTKTRMIQRKLLTEELDQNQEEGDRV